MKVLVLSDSHGSFANMEAALKKLSERISAVIHLGDFDYDAERIRQLCPGLPVYAVRGNNEYGSEGPLELTLTFNGAKVFCAHGNRHGVYYGLTRLLYAAEEAEAGTALFGHTHRPLCVREDGILIMNPGSISRPRGGKPSFGILDISENGTVRGSVMEVWGNEDFRPAAYA